MNGIRTKRAVFSVATVLALGFGAAQAFAAPRAPQKAAAMRACNWSYCVYDCRRRGHPGGECAVTSTGNTYCNCF